MVRAATERACAGVTPKKKILIVDDEPAIADTLDYVLRTDGFEPLCVGLGQLALEAIKDTDYVLVILDVGLPDMLTRSK